MIDAADAFGRRIARPEITTVKGKTMAWRRCESRIGVVGLWASGKTVLMTSLINHLERHDPKRFRLDADRSKRVCQFQQFVPGNGWRPATGWQCFNYSRYRQGLVDGNFPEKTGAALEFGCRFALHGRGFWRHDYQLRLFDIPGERLADSWMAGRSFAEWSDHILFMFGEDAKHQKALRPFLDLMERSEVDEAKLLLGYKTALARLILNHYKPYITPSTFLLDLGGNLADPADWVEKMARKGSAGLAGAEFAPLSAKLRAEQPALTERFTNHYRKYQATVVRPIFRTLMTCHALIVLVDVLGILANGPGMLNDTNKMISDLLNTLRPGNNMLRRVHQVATAVLPVGFRAGGIRKIAFVAPMVDRVAKPSDRENMKRLLQDMLEPEALNFYGLESCFECCSAVCAADVIDEEKRILVGCPIEDKPGERMCFPASPVPSAWPRDWKPEDYNFPFVHPDMPPVMLHPPRHINLDAIFEFVWS